MQVSIHLQYDFKSDVLTKKSLFLSWDYQLLCRKYVKIGQRNNYVVSAGCLILEVCATKDISELIF